MTNYRDDARCRDEDPETFFPVGDRETGPEVDVAKAICRACPISEECLQDHIDMAYGIVGATTPGERIAIRRRFGLRKVYVRSGPR